MLGGRFISFTHAAPRVISGPRWHEVVPRPPLEGRCREGEPKGKRKASVREKEEHTKHRQLVRDWKKAERARPARERGDSPTPPTDFSDEEWSSERHLRRSY